jgi:hypothetical protein
MISWRFAAASSLCPAISFWVFGLTKLFNYQNYISTFVPTLNTVVLIITSSIHFPSNIRHVEYRAGWCSGIASDLC